MIHHKNAFSINNGNLNIKYTARANSYNITIYIRYIDCICTAVIILLSKDKFSLYEVKNHIEYNDNIEFIRDIALKKQEIETWRNIDYCFSIGNDNYIVPYEILDFKLKIKKSLLEHFKI